ncbi:neuronal acetylcholine receptor subunit beta-3-like isoform X2 [Convolutriloba macropyga]|uniref:neuronal acetylcholine receptor subunit beta-3-like isoform X2 n=1 Tax=Convolutriloba macropyga TaxID=536237 RepID=UPI003F524822
MAHHHKEQRYGFPPLFKRGGADYGSGGLHSNTYLGGDAVSRMLLANYTFRSRPVVNTSNPIVVEVMLTVIQLITLHEKQQEMATKVWLDQYWTDEFLVWEPEDMNDITWMTFRSNEIWVPDIAIDNSIKYEREDMDIKVESGGQVWWSMPAVIRTSCNIDTKKFPFDTQTCKITLGSWYHSPSELDLVVYNNHSHMKTQYFMHNAQWDIVSTSIETVNEYLADYDMTFRTIDFKLSFRRKSLYFLLILIVPFVMISAVSLSNFVLPCESGEKISLGITVLLSLFVNLLNLVDLLPESSDSFPILGSYYLISMGLVASSVVMTVIVLNIHHQPIKSRRLVHLLREGAPFLFVARLLCVGRPVKTPKKFSKLNAHAYQLQPSALLNGAISSKDRSKAKRLSDSFSAKNHCNSSTAQHLKLIQTTARESFSELVQSCSDLNIGYPSLNSNFNGDIKSSPKHSANSAGVNKMKGAGTNLSPNPRILISPDDEENLSEHDLEMLRCLQLLQDIKDRLTREQSKDLEKEYQKYIKEEWRYLARVVDRLLGLCYVLTFIALIIAFS